MVSYAFPPLYSGAGAQALRLAQTLAQKGVVVSALTSRHDADLPTRDLLMGVPVYRLPVLKTGRLRPLSFSLVAAWHLLWRHRCYDIVHIHGAYWRILPMLLATKLTGRKSVVKMTQLGTDDPQAIRRRPVGQVLYRTLALADSVISTSRGLSDSYRNSALPSEKLVEIPNGVDTTLFHPAGDGVQSELRRRLDLPPNGPIVTFVGQVGYRKGADLLLQAWAVVADQVHDAWLMLIGPVGEDLPLPEGKRPIEYWLSRVSQTLALGHQTNVQDYLRASDIFVLPTRMEGLPNALLEAMATGLPCIASKVGGNVDLITHGDSGLLFEVDDVEQLVQALLRLLSGDRERQELGRRAREVIEANYALDEVASRYVQLYRFLLEDGS